MLQLINIKGNAARTRSELNIICKEERRNVRQGLEAIDPKIKPQIYLQIEDL